MSEVQIPQFPPNVVIFIRYEIARYQRYKVQFEHLGPYSGYDDYTKHKHEDKVVRVQVAMKNLMADIIEITKRHFPSIEVEPNSDAVTISNILKVLPSPEEIVVKKIFHGSQ